MALKVVDQIDHRLITLNWNFKIEKYHTKYIMEKVWDQHKQEIDRKIENLQLKSLNTGNK